MKLAPMPSNDWLSAYTSSAHVEAPEPRIRQVRRPARRQQHEENCGCFVCVEMARVK